MDVGIPLQISAKSIKDADKTRGKELEFIILVRHEENHTARGRKQAVQKRTVMEEKGAEFFCNGENVMAVLDADKLKGHGGSAIYGMIITTDMTELVVVMKRYKFKFTALRAAVYDNAIYGENYIIYNGIRFLLRWDKTVLECSIEFNEYVFEKE